MLYYYTAYKPMTYLLWRTASLTKRIHQGHQQQFLHNNTKHQPNPSFFFLKLLIDLALLVVALYPNFRHFKKDILFTTSRHLLTRFLPKTVLYEVLTTYKYFKYLNVINIATHCFKNNLRCYRSVISRDQNKKSW